MPSKPDSAWSDIRCGIVSSAQLITLDQVRSFVAVAEELHFGRAAERLQMTQPPLSRQIQKLEKAVGAQLLARDNRRVELTGAGTAFLDEAYRLLNLVEGAGDLARRVDAGAAGVSASASPPCRRSRSSGPLLRRLTAELPDVEVRLSERVTMAQVDGIRRGELDIGLARPPFDTALLSSRVVRSRAADGGGPRGPSARPARAAVDAAGLRGAGGDRYITPSSRATSTSSRCGSWPTPIRGSSRGSTRC